MKRLLVPLASLLLLCGPAAASTDPTPAPLQPQLQHGIRFLSGGVGDSEREKLDGMAHDYDVRVTLTRPDGAYLSDVQVVIQDAAGKPLVETTTQGPILLAELAPGHYELRASRGDSPVARRTIDVPAASDHVRLYVALNGEPAKGNGKAA